MKFWVGVTDRNWFEFLKARGAEEANFWQPSARPVANFLAPGTPFLFKLHSPDNYVVGGGYFVRFTALPLGLAWAAFKEDNGVRNIGDLMQRLARYRREAQTIGAVIGCNVLAEPFFLDEKDWIPIPTDWSSNIVRGKTYDSEVGTGRALWNAVCERAAALALDAAAQDAPNPEQRYGAEYLARGRIGQGAFRILVTDAWHRRCAVTGERTLPALEAAHIMPYAERGPHQVSNGLLLRADLHRLFDDGYVTLEQQRDSYRFIVSSRVKEEFENGREYYRYHGEPLQRLPDGDSNRPAKEYLAYHNEQVFTG